MVAYKSPHTGRVHIANAPVLTENSVDNTPSLINGPLVAIDAEMYSFDELESLIVTMVRHGCVYQGARLVVRESARRSDSSSMEAVEDLDFAGCLEQRLSEQNIHIMIPFLDRCHPPTQRLLEEFVKIVRPVLESIHTGMFEPSAGLFVNAPHSIVRLHNDPEHGFLHQLRGEKQIHLFPYDEERIRPTDVPRDRHPFRSVDASRRYMDDFRDREFIFDLRPGHVVHIPNLTPHWVRNGVDIGMSLTFNFFSRAGIRRQKVEQFNRWLEHRGLKAAPYKPDSPTNALKCGTFNILEKFGRLHLT